MPAGPGGGYCHTRSPHPATFPDLVATLPHGVSVALRRVIVDIRTFAIVGAIELDDASHLKKQRIRRDILLEEVLRQAGIPLLRDRDSEKLVRRVSEFLKYREAETDEISASGTALPTAHTERREDEK